MYSRLSGPTASSRLRRVWLDLGDPGAFVRPSGPLERWQDHGLGLLRTILRDAGVDRVVIAGLAGSIRMYGGQAMVHTSGVLGAEVIEFAHCVFTLFVLKKFSMKACYGLTNTRLLNGEGEIYARSALRD